MKSVQQSVNVTIMGREFSVACPEDRRSALLAAAAYLDGQMREIHRTGKVIGLERCAIMAALNISDDLLTMRNEAGTSSDLAQRLKHIHDKIDSIVRQDQKELAF